MSEPTNQARLLAAEILLVFAVFFLQGAWPVPDINEAHYLSKAIHYWNPDWVPADTFLDSADTHKVFYLTIGWLSLWLPPTPLAWVGRIFCWGLMAWSWRRLSFSLVRCRWASVLTAAAFVCLQSRFQMAGEWVIGGVEAKGFAYALVFLGLESLVLGRWNRTWLLFGGAGAFHVLVGGWSVVAAGVAWMLSGPARPSIRSMGPSLAGGLLLALPGLIPSLSLTRGVDPVIVQEANRIYVFERLAHHLVPSRFAAMDVIRFLLLTGIWIAISWIRPVDEGQRRLRSFVVGTLLLTLVGVAIAWSTAGNPALAASLLRFYWFRMSDFAVPAAVALAGPGLLAWQLCRSRPETILTRSASEVGKLFPRLRFGLVCDVSSLSGSGTAAAGRSKPAATLRWWTAAVTAWLVGIVAIAGLFHAWSAWQWRVAPGKEIALAIVLLCVWFAIWIRARWASPSRETARGWLAVALAAALLPVVLAPVSHVGYYAYLRCRPVAPRADRANVNYFAWQRTCQWIVDHPEIIPPDARFFTPLTSHTFKWYTARSEVATWKDIPQDPRSIVAWWKRLNDIYAIGVASPRERWHGRLLDALYSRDAAALERLRIRYEADYVLTVRRPPLDLEVVYRNNAYVIYRLDDQRQP